MGSNLRVLHVSVQVYAQSPWKDKWAFCLTEIIVNGLKYVTHLFSLKYIPPTISKAQMLEAFDVTI